MIRFFGEKIGQPYPYAKYAQVCVPDFIAGGMENITATTMTDTALHDEIAALEDDDDGLVAHELAHQWFGDLLDLQGLVAHLAQRGLRLLLRPAFHRARPRRRCVPARDERDRSTATWAATRVIAARSSSRDTNTSDDMFDGVTYSKGACVLHVLRGLLGDEAWWKGIRGYVAAHKLQVVETRRFPQGDGSGFGQGPEVVLRPVGLQGRPPRAQGSLAL